MDTSHSKNLGYKGRRENVVRRMIGQGFRRFPRDSGDGAHIVKDSTCSSTMGVPFSTAIGEANEPERIVRIEDTIV